MLIGNELLTGRVPDANLAFLASELWKLGVPVREARVVPDALETVRDAIRELASRCDWLLTTGGIGPTHDDLTIDAVAAAFSVEVVSHPELEAAIRKRCGDELTTAHLRMARVPAGCVLEAGTEGHWPTIRIENTFILPGVPSILQRKFSRLRALFEQGCFHRVLVETTLFETQIAEELAQIDRNNPRVQVGSYPQAECVVVCFEGWDTGDVERAAAAFKERLATR